MTEKRSAIHSLGERKFATHLEVIAPNGISRIFLPLCFIFFIMKRFPSQPFGVVFSKIQNVAAWSHKAQNECEKSFHFKYPIQNFGESAEARQTLHMGMLPIYLAVTRSSRDKLTYRFPNISSFGKSDWDFYYRMHLVLLKALNCHVFSFLFLNEEKEKWLIMNRERRSRFTHGTL